MLSFIITWGRERESGIHLLKISLNSLSGESSCSRRTVEEEVDAAMKEGGQGWGLGPPSLCHEAWGSLCFSCVLLTVTSMPCLARGSPGWCSHLVSLLRSTPSFLSSLVSLRSPTSASFLPLPPPRLRLGLCVWFLALDICNSQSVFRDTMPFPHTSSGRLNCIPPQKIC